MLKKRITAAMLVVGLISPAVIMAQPPQENQKQEQREERREGKEGHPAIRNAIKALERAKYDLEHADHDFGGHRAEALESVNNAIRQLNQALQYDKK